MNNLYYRPTTRSSRRSIFTKTRYLKFIYPLIGLVLAILVLWGLIRVWGFFSDINSTNFENSATVFVAEGTTAQKQSFGSTTYLPILSGEILLEGDSVRTLQGTRVVLEFFNGLVVRLDQGSNLIVETIENKDDDELIELKLTAGSAWVNKPVSMKSNSDLYLSTNYIKAQAAGTIFAVKSGLPEAVRVIEGVVLAEIIDPTDASSLDQVNVGINQELVLDNASLEAFKGRETPSVLGAIDSKFEASTWYKWNSREDANPTDYDSDPALEVDENLISTEPEDSLDEDSANLDSEEDNADGERPEFSFPTNGAIINTDLVTITGTVPANTQKVVVTSFETGVAEPYVLRGFKPGDATFRYIAKFDGTEGNLIEGVNKFEVVAVDENGVESGKDTLTFTLDLDGKPEPTDSDDSESDAPTSPNVDISGLEFADDLPAPTLVSVNDVPAQNGFTLSENRGVVVGNVGTWAKSVVVNGYKLQQYVPYSGTFTYILSEGFGTLKPGENKIVVYGFDKDARRGQPATFIINWSGN